MATWGLMPEGWLGKPLAVIEIEIDDSLKAILGESAGTESDGTIPLRSVAGQLKVDLTDGFSAIWDMMQALYASWDPNSATDSALDRVCEITGTLREPAKFSSVTATCCGTPGTVLPEGRVATVETAGTRFLSAVEDTIDALTAWAQSTGYTAGDRVTANSKCYVCITTGTSSNSGTGPATEDDDITDGTAHWRWIGDGTGAIDIEFDAETAGPFGALSGTLNTIGTPVGGWSTVRNLADATIGAAEETDAALRARREAELAGDGNGTPDAIRANILQVNESSVDPDHLAPTACIVFHNDTDVTNVDGLPPHSVEVLVLNGTDDDIALAVFNSVAAGIATYGNQTSTVTDSQGNPQTVKWSRPTEIPIYVSTTVYYNPAKWPASGAAALVEQAALSALLTWADSNFTIGQSVRAQPLGAAIVDEPSQLDADGNAVVPASATASPAPGILDVNPVYIDTAPSPSASTTIAIGPREIATFDSANIDITAVSEDP